MSTTLTCDDLLDQLYINWLNNAEVWVVDYATKDEVYRFVLKEMSLPGNFMGFSQSAEEIYMISKEDSKELLKILLNADVPVFGPSGERLG